MATIKINTDQVREIADTMSKLNKELRETLDSCQNTVTNLSSVWSGEAYEATKSAVNSFAQQYFQTYEDILDSYVKFLQYNVAEGYTETEVQNTDLSQNFK